MNNFRKHKPVFQVSMTDSNQECFTLHYEKNKLTAGQLDVALDFIEAKQTAQAMKAMLKLLFIAINDPNNDLSGEDKLSIEFGMTTLTRLMQVSPQN